MKRIKTGKEPNYIPYRYFVRVSKGGQEDRGYECNSMDEVKNVISATTGAGRRVEVFKAKFEFKEAWISEPKVEAGKK